MAVEGIEQAHVRISETGPTGVRVVLAADADPALVADSIRQLFSVRGLSVSVEGTGATVTSIGGDGTDRESSDRDEHAVEPPSVASDESVPQPPAGGDQPETPEAAVVATAAPLAPLSRADLAVAVSEGSSHCDVAVRVGPSRRAVRRATPDVVSIREAIVDGLNEALGRRSVRPSVVSFDRKTVAGRAMVTVVLESGGQVGVGSAFVSGTEPYAFGVAAVQALQQLPDLA